MINLQPVRYMIKLHSEDEDGKPCGNSEFTNQQISMLNLKETENNKSW